MSTGHERPGTAIGRSVLDMAAREGLSVRATYERVLPTMGGNMVKGDPVQVADMMEDWYRSKACDGKGLRCRSTVQTGGNE